MEKAELQEWFDRVWFKYPKDLSHNKKGAKPPALKASEKIYKAQGIEELNRIERNIEALINYDRKELKAGGRPDRWPHFSTFLNQGYYDREIESHAELQEKIERQHCQCGKESVISGKCSRCYTKSIGDKSQMPISIHKEQLDSLNLGRLPGETTAEWGKRCREYSLKKHPDIVKIVVT